MRAVADGSKLPISCYIRTLNEAGQISRVIEAVKPVTDEVILIDCGSTDDTIRLAEAAGAKVVHQSWLGWGKQKRAGEDASRNGWILDIDADEVMTEELRQEIRELFANGEPSAKVYGLKLVTAPPVGTPWYNSRIDYRNKLYDRRTIRMPDHHAWDQLDVPTGMAVGRLKGALLHYSFRNLAHLNEKFNRDSSNSASSKRHTSITLIGLRVLFAKPFYFFKTYIMRGLWRVGLYGFIVSCIAANGRWLRDAKVFEKELMEREKRRREAAQGKS